MHCDSLHNCLQKPGILEGLTLTFAMVNAPLPAETKTDSKNKEKAKEFFHDTTVH